MKKRFLRFGIPAALLVLFIILTVVLCCSTVFNGKYKGKNPLYTDYKYEIIFNGKTVTYTLTREGEWQDNYFGFYQKVENGIELSLTSPSEQTVELNRKNVFTLTKTVDNLNSWNGELGGVNTEMELKCYGAIWLQVFYSTGTVASAVFLTVQIARQRKTK